MTFNKLLQSLKGGSGSGNFGHAGRPGKKGGSMPGSAGYVTPAGPVRGPAARVQAVHDMMDGQVIKSTRQISKMHEASTYARHPDYAKFHHTENEGGTIVTRGYSEWTSPSGAKLRVDRKGLDTQLTFTDGGRSSSMEFRDDYNWGKSGSFTSKVFGLQPYH